MKKDKLTVPLLERAGCGNQELNGICVKGRSRELLLEIQKMLDVFAPNGDDYRHSIWIEVPRGKPSDWCGYNEAKVWANQEVYTRSDYLKEWKSNYPREAQWYHLAVTRYEGHTWLHMVENDQWWCMIHDNEDKYAHSKDMEWLLKPLADYLREKVPQIVADVSVYNQYVERNLPKRQRTGRISRKDLDRIVPWQRHLPRNVKRVIRMLKECIVNEEYYKRMKEGEKVEQFPACYREPLPAMSIRIYAKYFRLAYCAYKEHFRRLYRQSRREVREYKEWQEKSSALTDIEFYRSFQLGRHGEITDETDFDSEQAFKDMAFDHYGELGLSRMDVHATDYYTDGGWLISFGVSYSAWVDAGCEIALALYEAGAPLLLYDAQKMLDILEEQDFVKLTPHTFHDYLNHHNEGSVFDLPYDCYLGKGDEITREQYDEIVSLAQWDQVSQLVLDEIIPLNDPVYDLIREFISEPLTACGILWELEKKYSVVVGIIDRDDWHEAYLCEHGGDDLRINLKNIRFDTANEAMLAVMREFGKLKKQKK